MKLTNKKTYITGVLLGTFVSFVTTITTISGAYRWWMGLLLGVLLMIPALVMDDEK